MNTPRRTRFLINFPGFTAELEGERTFVEDLYRKIVRDVGPIIAAGADAVAPPPTSAGGKAEPPQSGYRGGYVWVYLCTSLFNKVYVVDHATVDSSILGRFVDVDRLRRIYLNEEKTATRSGLTVGSRTLWAEFTEEGRALLRKSGDTNAGQDQARRR